MENALTRQQLEQLPLKRIHDPRNWSKATVSVGEWPQESGRRVVVKDFRDRPLWYRVLFARHVLKREWIALRAARGLPAAPAPIARPDTDSIVIEHRPGTSAEEFPPGKLPTKVIQNVEEAIHAMHSRGITHGDLHRENILVADDGRVSFIDWATASSFGPHPRGLKARAFREWVALDERALAKLKFIHAREILTEHEMELLRGGGSTAYRLVKGVGRLKYVFRGRQAPSELPLE